MLQGLQQCGVGIAYRVPGERHSWDAWCTAPKRPPKAAAPPPSARRCEVPPPGPPGDAELQDQAHLGLHGSLRQVFGRAQAQLEVCGVVQCPNRGVTSFRYVSALTTPARLSPVDFHYSMATQVPTFEITSPNSAHAVSLPPAAPISFRVEEQQPLLRRYQLPFQDTQRYDSYYQRKTYLNDSMGSLPSSPFRITEDDEYETTQEYVTALEQPKKTASSNRRWKKSKLNGHVPHRARAVRDSFSLSSASYSESDEELVAESTPFLSTQNNEAAHTESPPLHRPGDSRTHYSCGRHSAHTESGRSSLAHATPKPDPHPL